MALPRFDRLPPARRAEILAVAARHFAERGYDGAALNAILAELGLSKGAAYYYFVDKADLFCTVIEAAWARFAADIDRLRALGPAPFWAETEALWLRQVEALEETPDLFRVTRRLGEALADPDVAQAILTRLAPAVTALRGLLHHGQALGAVRTDLPEELLVGMIGGLDQAIDGWLLGPGAAVPTPERLALARVAFGSLRALAAPQARP